MELLFLKNLATLEAALMEVMGFGVTQFFYILALVAAVHKTGDINSF